MSEKTLIGKVTHYFTKIGVAVVQVENEIVLGDMLSFEGATTDFTQPLDSMQVDNNPVETAKKGDDIGLKVKERVRPGDHVYKVA